MKRSTLFTILLFTSLSTLCAQSEALIKKTNTGLTKMEFPNNGNNLILGSSSGEGLDLGVRNVLLGSYNGNGLINGSENTFVGVNAGTAATGAGNVGLGYQAGNMNTGNFNVFLGQYAGALTGDISNSLYIENAQVDSTQALIYGEFDNDVLRFNAATDIFSSSTTDEGLLVEKNHTGNFDIPAVLGRNRVSDYYGVGVQGEGNYRGVFGRGFGLGGGTYTGVYGEAANPNPGNNRGISGYASQGASNYAVRGITTNGLSNYAGYFSGKVWIKANSLDSVFLSVENDAGESQLSVTKDSVIINANLVAKSQLKLDSDGVKFDDDGVINKTAAVKYYIATTGDYPSTDLPSPPAEAIGRIMLFPAHYASFVTASWQECDGSLLNIADHTALFSLLGTTYGGDGLTTFGIPDLRNAVPLHN